MVAETRVLTFEEFRAKLAKVFDVPEDALQSDTNFLEDLAFDSLRMLQLGVLLEDLDVEMPDELAWSIQTVGEAYAYYEVAKASASSPSRPENHDDVRRPGEGAERPGEGAETHRS